MNKKRIVFLTGTRADFSKLKSLIAICQMQSNLDVHIFVTGMHMNSKYGKTVDEIAKSGFENIYQFINHDAIENMDRTLAKTIDGFSHYIAELKPDLIVVHGDRVEALAGAIVGSINNILVAHVEGGEISGTIDELIRHAVSKMSHIHFVANEEAKRRLIQLGELPSSVFIIGSPDLDLMNPSSLPSLDLVKRYYEINFDRYSIAMFHPVTTEYESIRSHAQNFVKALISSELNYVVIFPNNDMGSNEILMEYKAFEGNDRFRVFPSLRFEYFLTLLNCADFIIGNSSAGVREAPFYHVPTVDIGSRQNNRVSFTSMISSSHEVADILNSIKKTALLTDSAGPVDKSYFGEGDSDKKFLALLNSGSLWEISHQKQFQEISL